jgi:hypothetical protein
MGDEGRADPPIAVARRSASAPASSAMGSAASASIQTVAAM